MIDSKIVMNQVQELQIILHEIHAKGMKFSESFQVATIIEKLPPMWKDFKNYLKYKRKEMRLEDLIVRLRIEEDNRNSEKKPKKLHMEAKVNLVESNTGKKRKHSGNGKQKSKAKKFKGDCYNCGKPTHIANDCRQKNQNRKKKEPSTLDRGRQIVSRCV